MPSRRSCRLHARPLSARARLRCFEARSTLRGPYEGVCSRSGDKMQAKRSLEGLANVKLLPLQSPGNSDFSLGRRGPRKERAESVLIFLPSQEFFKQRFALRLSQRGVDTFYRMPLAPLVCPNAIVRLARICGIALGLARHARGAGLLRQIC